MAEPIPTEELNPTELPVPADESTVLKVDPQEPSPLLEGEGSGELSTPKPQRLPSAPQSAGQLTADLFTGSATYGYQLSVPEGRAGLTPPIVLRYSSARRTDLGRVGMRGWDIEVGHVERTSKQGVDKLYATSAAFTLYPPGSGGAVELVPLQLEADGIHGTYGAETESDFALVTFATSNSWTVVDRGGTTWTYGTSSASREYDPADESRVSSWYVAGATGPTGATMRYGYLRHGNALYAASVDYGGQVVSGSEETGPFRVELEYGSMADRVISYRTGYPVYRQLKLGEVRAFVNGSLRQQYNFGPASGGAAGVASLLAYIQETRYSATGSALSLPATSFQYHAVPTTTWATVTGTTTATFPQALASCQDQTCIDMNVLSVDLNGDGRQEVIRPQFNAQDGQSEFHLAERTHSLRGDGTWSDDTSWDLAVPGVGSSNELGAGRVHYLDLNGDGRTDALVARRRQNGTDDRRVYLNTGTTWELNASWTVPMYVYGDNLVGDFNGDGLPDFATSSAMTVNSSGYTAAEMSAVYLNTGSGWELNASWTVPFALKVCSFHAGVCDGGNIPFYRDEQYKYRLMELNGDGLPDVVYSWENDSTGQQRAVFLNTGTGWVATTTASQWGSFPSWYKCYTPDYICGLEAQAPSSPAHTQTVDLNGDGIDDVLFTHLVNGTAELHPGVIGQGVVGAPHNLPKLELALGDMSASKSRFGDFNGDGQLDLGWAHEASTTHDYRRYIQVNQPDYLLKAVVEPTGATTTLAYTEAHQYFDAASSTVPLSGALPYAVWTPSRVTVAPGNSQPEQVTDYVYEGGAAAWSSSTDREFAGFWKVSATSGDTKTVTEFHQGIGGLPLTTSTQLHPDRGQYSDEPAKRGRVYRTEVRDASSDDLLSAQVTKWESATLDGPNRKFVYPSRTTSFVAKASGLDATAVERTFDTATGNELSTFSRGSVTADSGTGDISGELGTDQSTEDKQYATSSSARILGAPKLAQVKDAGQQVIAEKEIRYDGLPLGQVSQGKPTRVEDKMPSSAVYATYDSYANVASSSDPRGATTTFSYDAAYHLAPTRSVNPLGHVTLQEVDLATRQVASTTDANGANERWIRDGFGRPLERWIQNPTTTGVVLAERWAYGDADRPVWVRHEAFDSVGDATPATDYTYADGAGRVIQTRAQEDASTFIVGDTLYDSQGRVARQSLPYRGTGSSYATPSSTVPSTTYAYDAAGRVTDIFAPAGNTSVAYDGLVTRVTDALGRIAEQERDGQGRLVRVTRWLNSQPVTYGYEWDAAGRLTGMQDPGGNTREFTYDGQGRLLTQTDWHATSSSPDTWAYAYDAAGNVTSSTDPRGATIHYTYDALNRVLTANDPSTAGTDTTYSYDDTGSRGVGRLREAIHRGVRSTYDYDRLGRTITVDRNILGERLVQDYDYDLVGRELERDEPNGYKVWATYDRLGRWATTTATVGTTTATVASALSYTPLGQLESVLYGNGLVTRDTYTPEDGYRLARRTTGEEGSYLQDLNYEYDAVGNVTHLLDESLAEPLGKDHAYSYDALDRLVGVQGTNTYGDPADASSTFSYDILGSMRIRGAHEMYRLMYNGHPYRPSHAVIGGDGLMPFSWDAAGNLVEVGANLYQYDGFGRLATATYSNDDTFLDTFAYGHSGSRAYRSHDTLGDELDPAATYSLGTYEQDSDGAARLFIDAPGRRLAQVTVDPQGAPTVQYLHQDALGSSPLATAPSGDPAALADQDPYGLPRFTKLPDGGSAPARSYTGKELDPSSWYYFGARYYDPQMARFTQVDPVTLGLGRMRPAELAGLLSDPRRLHPYSYAGNNPMKYQDPDGQLFDVLLDVGFIAYDLYRIGSQLATQGHVSKGELAALGADVGGAFVPFGTGFGMVARTAMHADDVAKAGRVVSKAASGADKASQIAKKYQLGSDTINHVVKGDQFGGGHFIDEAMSGGKLLEGAKTDLISRISYGLKRLADGRTVTHTYFPSSWTIDDVVAAGKKLETNGVKVGSRYIETNFKGITVRGNLNNGDVIGTFYPVARHLPLPW